jgi:hypothetical protein
MAETDPASWLTQEVRDHLDQGPVGLYELIWGLRGTSFCLSEAEAIRLSATVVERVVSSGMAALYAVSWPSMAVEEGPLPAAVLQDPKSWSEGESGPLIALVPNEASDV